MTPKESQTIEARLEQLNHYTRRTHTQDEVFLFDVKLCDNEIDRDGERFSREALGQLKALFVGRTGIFDHNPRGENQNARIFGTELVEEPERMTTAGEPYTYLKGHAYMIRTDANRDLIREIDGGIKKEVSISCTANARTCSICGHDRRKSPCTHQPGRTYAGQLCHTVLSDITDAYEWSFVAIPAQREAGVTKQFRDGKQDAARWKMLEEQLKEKQALLSRVEAMVRQDIIRLRFLVDGKTEQDAVAKAAERMDLEELLAFQKTLRTKQKQQCAPQLTRSVRETQRQAENTAFQI